jgi:hypothetical protein
MVIATFEVMTVASLAGKFSTFNGRQVFISNFPNQNIASFNLHGLTAFAVMQKPS